MSIRNEFPESLRNGKRFALLLLIPIAIFSLAAAWWAMPITLACWFVWILHWSEL